jgi:hypothetical protein
MVRPRSEGKADLLPPLTRAIKFQQALKQRCPPHLHTPTPKPKENPEVFHRVKDQTASPVHRSADLQHVSASTPC